MDRAEINRLIEELCDLLDRQYAQLLAWRPQELLKIVEEHQLWQEKLSQALGKERTSLDEELRNKLKKLQLLGRRNLVLARAGLQVIEGLNRLLGREEPATYQRQGATSGQALVERFV